MQDLDLDKASELEGILQVVFEGFRKNFSPNVSW